MKLNSRLWWAIAASVGLVASTGCGDSTECGAGTVEVDGVCVADAPTCAAGTTLVNNECVPDGSVICGAGTTFNEATGECDADVTGCGEGLVLDDNGACVDPTSLWDPDVTEPSEPNGFEGTPGEFTLPEIGESVTIGGCINPADLDADGAVDVDFDAFLFTASQDVVLDITVEGTGGLSGGFLMVSPEPALLQNDWQRLGVNLVNETSRRQVYLPGAGTYALAISDGRSLITGSPAGNAGACYQATVAVLAVPEPTAITTDSVSGKLGDVQVFSYDPAEGDILFNEIAAPGQSVLGDAVQLVNGVYRSSAPGPGARDLGSLFNLFIDGLADDDEVVFVIDPILNFSLDEEPFTLTIAAPGATLLPTDDTVTIDNDGFLFRWMYFDGMAGDILQLDMDTTADAVLFTVAGPGLTVVSDVCPQGTFGGGGCGLLGDTFIQLPVTGRYYIRLFDLTEPQPASFAITISSELVQPQALDSVEGIALSARAVDWYELNVTDRDWAVFSGTATGFGGDLEISLYDRNAFGEVDVDFQSLDEFSLDGVVEVERPYAGDSSLFLVRVGDTGLAPGGGTYDLSIGERTFTDLGAVVPATPIEQTGETVAAGERVRYLVSGTDSDLVTVTITGTGGFDPVFEQLSSSGDITVVDDTGADDAETSSIVLTAGPGSFVAFAVSNEGTEAGTFDIRVTAASPNSYTSSPGIVIPDNDPAGAEDTLTATDACTIAGISVDVNISHTFIGDLNVRIISPTGTEVVLHDDTGGSADDIVGNYPNTLTPDGNLDSLLGEEAMGDWTIRMVDSFNGDEGTLNSWGINVFCE